MYPYFKFFLMEQAGDTTAGGGSDLDEGTLNIDMEVASDAIGADLGLNDGEGTDSLDSSSATPLEDGDNKAAPVVKKEAAPVAPVLDDKGQPITDPAALKAKTDAEAAAAAAKGAVKAAPKSWKKEMHESFSKLPPEVQAYVEQREAQVEEGFKAQAGAVRYASSLWETIQPYQAMLDAQGIKDHGSAVKFLMNAHYVLSTAPQDKKEGFFAELAKSYGIDMDKALAVFKSGAPQESLVEKELRNRLTALEGGRHEELQRQVAAVKQQSMAEVEAFASDPKNVYFDEVAGDVSLLLKADGKLTLPQAYEAAIYANPVTRAKELTRLQTEASTKLAAEAEAKAKLAEKAKGTVVKGDENHRESPDLLGTMDQTLKETMRKINSRA